MSVGAWEREEAATAEANTRAAEAALAIVKKRGLAIVTERETVWVQLDEEAREICRRPADSVGSAVIALSISTTSSSPAHGAERVTAARSDACDFVRGARDLIEVDAASGPRTLARLGQLTHLARDAAGRRVLIHMRPEVTSRRVLVEMQCNHMPSPVPGPFERPSPVRAYWTEPGPEPGSVDIVFEREELEVACTDNVY